MDAIYLDHAATTSIRPEALEAMHAVLAEGLGNASSMHRWGRAARSRLEEARERIAAVLGARRHEIVFTSGGTESDHLAVQGRWRAYRQGGRPGVVVCSAVEHKAVLSAIRATAQEGASAVILAVDETGRVEEDSLREALAAEPTVVSVIWGNNEVGTLQPIAQIADRCREAGVAFHSDAVQALGRVPIAVGDMGIDLLTVSAHKIGGPTGIGALYVRDGVELEPFLTGGGQERGLRSGTANVAAAVGFAVATELAERDRVLESERLGRLRDRLEAGLLTRVPGLVVNGAGAERLPQILNISIPGVDQEALLMALDLEGLAVSSGSACQSGAVEPSHVLVAMGRTAPDEASIRFSLGRTTTEAEIDSAIDRFTTVVDRVRSLANR